MKSTDRHKLVITGQDKTPVEISKGGVIIHRYDIATAHEEADNIMMQLAIRVACREQRSVKVLTDDIGVYALLLYHYLEQICRCPR